MRSIQLNTQPRQNASGNCAVELQGVSRSYSTAKSEVRAVDGVSLYVARNERIAILGKSGCGKSTLLNLIGGLDCPSSGTIRVQEMVLSRMRSAEMAAYRRHHVGMVFQSYNLIPSRTALGNVELPAIFAGCQGPIRRQAASEALTAVGLSHRLTHKPAELSGGEQQRVAIARALINRPSLLLADEPTGNLDSRTAGEIVHLLNETVQASGMTMIFVTHDEHLAGRLSTRVVRMADGRILESGSPEAPCV